MYHKMKSQYTYSLCAALQN